MQRHIIGASLAAVVFVVSGCSVSHGTSEQRVVELPKGNPDSSLATAQQICQQVAASGIAQKVQKRFPSLTPEQIQRGIILRAMSGNFSQGGQTTFIITGFYYEGSLPDAKAIADYVESIVREAVAARFGSAVPSSSP